MWGLWNGRPLGRQISETTCAARELADADLTAFAGRYRALYPHRELMRYQQCDHESDWNEFLGHLRPPLCGLTGHIPTRRSAS